MPASAREFQTHPARYPSNQTNIGTTFLATLRLLLTLFSVDYTTNIAWFRRLLEFLRSTTRSGEEPLY